MLDYIYKSIKKYQHIKACFLTALYLTFSPYIPCGVVGVIAISHKWELWLGI